MHYPEYKQIHMNIWLQWLHEYMGYYGIHYVCMNVWLLRYMYIDYLPHTETTSILNYNNVHNENEKMHIHVQCSNVHVGYFMTIILDLS